MNICPKCSTMTSEDICPNCGRILNKSASKDTSQDNTHGGGEERPRQAPLHPQSDKEYYSQSGNNYQTRNNGYRNPYGGNRQSDGFSSMDDKPWYTAKWFTILLLFLFWPLGIVTLWLFKPFKSIGTRIAITAIPVILAIVGIVFVLGGINTATIPQIATEPEATQEIPSQEPATTTPATETPSTGASELPATSNGNIFHNIDFFIPSGYKMSSSSNLCNSYFDDGLNAIFINNTTVGSVEQLPEVYPDGEWMNIGQFYGYKCYSDGDYTFAFQHRGEGYRIDADSVDVLDSVVRNAVVVN